MQQTLHRVATRMRDKIKRKTSRRWQDDKAKKEGPIWNRTALYR